MNPLSWQFSVFIVATLSAYYASKTKTLQTSTLILAGFLFYALYSPALTALLAASMLFNATASFLIGRYRHRKAFLGAGITANIALLLSFKIFHPAIETSSLFAAVAIPLGLSFYSFLGISLLVDTYKHGIGIKKYPEHLRNSVLYIGFFPQIASGPITKSRDFMPQIEAKRLDGVNWGLVFRWLVLGLFLKTVIADNLKDFTFYMQHPYFEVRGSGTLMLMLVGYSVEIFADFAGYSLIALAVALSFGYRLPQNFNLPYISASFREFWSRWHISLSQFFQEYLYFPLGGNRRRLGRTCLNLLVVMVVCGLWHGLSAVFIAWGIYHGIFMAIDRLTNKSKRVRMRPLRAMLTYILVTVGWLFFTQYDIAHVWRYLEFIAMPNEALFLDPKFLPIAIYALPIVIWHILGYFRETKVVKALRRYDYVAWGVMLFLIITNSGSFSPFIYFQF